MTDSALVRATNELVDRYVDAWNRHDVDAIVSMHTPTMVFENHTSHECAEGESVSAPNGRQVRWDGVDILPIEDGLVARKDAYSDRLAVLRQTASALDEDPAPSSWRERTR